MNGLFDIQGTQDDLSLPRLVSVYGMAGSSLGKRWDFGGRKLPRPTHCDVLDTGPWGHLTDGVSLTNCCIKLGIEHKKTYGDGSKPINPFPLQCGAPQL